MRWSKAPPRAPKPKRALFADKSPKAAPAAPAWLGTNPAIVAERARQRMSAPPPSLPPREEPLPPPPLPTPPAEPPSFPIEETTVTAIAVPAVSPPPAPPPGPSQAEIEALAALKQALSDIGSLREVIFAQTERQLVELAVTIARQVIAHEIAMDPGVLVGLAREGIRALDEKDKIVVKFGAALDDGLLSDFTEALRKEAPRCEVQVDPALGARECVVETELGRVDESVETRLYNVIEALVP